MSGYTIDEIQEDLDAVNKEILRAISQFEKKYGFSIEEITPYVDEANNLGVEIKYSVSSNHIQLKGGMN